MRRYLTERNADWIEDPANVNPAFERVRVRAKLGRKLASIAFASMAQLGVVLGRAAMGETVRQGALRDRMRIWRGGR